MRYSCLKSQWRVWNVVIIHSFYFFRSRNRFSCFDCVFFVIEIWISLQSFALLNWHRNKCDDNQLANWIESENNKNIEKSPIMQCTAQQLFLVCHSVECMPINFHLNTIKIECERWVHLIWCILALLLTFIVFYEFHNSASDSSQEIRLLRMDSTRMNCCGCVCVCNFHFTFLQFQTKWKIIHDFKIQFTKIVLMGFQRTKPRERERETQCKSEKRLKE